MINAPQFLVSKATESKEGHTGRASSGLGGYTFEELYQRSHFESYPVTTKTSLGMAKMPEGKQLLDCSHGPPGPSETPGTVPQRGHRSGRDPTLRECHRLPGYQAAGFKPCASPWLPEILTTQ